MLTGIPELLAQLSRREDQTFGLVTGNYEAIARLKLRRAGIGHWFDGGIGAFGSDAEDRTELPAIARRRAGAPGTPYPRERTVVIGDTPRDIACAHADGAAVRRGRDRSVRCQRAGRRRRGRPRRARAARGAECLVLLFISKATY